MINSHRVLLVTLPKFFNESENVLYLPMLLFVVIRLLMEVKKNVIVVSKKIVTLLVTNVAIQLITNKRVSDVNVKTIREQIENMNVRRLRARAVRGTPVRFVDLTQFVQMSWIVRLNSLVMEKAQNVLCPRRRKIILIVIKIQWSVIKDNAHYQHAITIMVLLKRVNVKSTRQQV